MKTFEAIKTFERNPDNLFISKDIHGETIMQLTSQGNIKIIKYSLTGRFIEEINTGININDVWKKESRNI